MKVLLYNLSPTKLESWTMVSDYQIDMLLHGLRQLSDVEVIEYPHSFWMYKNFKTSDSKKIWGKGFNLYHLLDDHDYDYSDLGERIRNKYFDLVIIGIHHTANMHDELLFNAVQKLSTIYDKKQLMIIDGHDKPRIRRTVLNLCGAYFKRELSNADKDVARPLHFAIPREKIYPDNTLPIKIYGFAPHIPVMHSWGGHPHAKSYIYDTEQEYNQQFRDSFFSYVCKKAGYDSFRPYESLANDCLPFWTDIENYPKTVLTNWPKDLLIEVKKLPGLVPGTVQPYLKHKTTFIGDTREIKPGKDRGYIDWSFFNWPRFYEVRRELKNWMENHLTTEHLAKYILEHA